MMFNVKASGTYSYHKWFQELNVDVHNTSVLKC